VVPFSSSEEKGTKTFLAYTPNIFFGEEREKPLSFPKGRQYRLTFAAAYPFDSHKFPQSVSLGKSARNPFLFRKKGVSRIFASFYFVSSRALLRA